MKLKLWLLPFLSLYLILISATTTTIEPASVPTTESTVAKQQMIETLATHKLNFVERLLLKRLIKKFETGDASKADGQAKTSLGFGIAAISAIVLGLFVPYVILLSIPAAIVAMVMGKSAVRSGTQYEGKANTGKALGLASLITLGVLLILAAIVVASWSGWG